MARDPDISAYQGGLERLSLLLSQLQQPVTSSLVQLVVRIDSLPMLDWLKAQPTYPKLYWQNRQATQEVAAIGVVDNWWLSQAQADKADWLRLTMGDTAAELRYYGGQGFRPDDPHVTELGGNRLYLPRIEIRREQNQWLLLVNLALQPDDFNEQIQLAQQALAELADPIACQPPQAHIESNQHLPEYEEWARLVTRTTQPEQLTINPKVVLCRETRLQLKSAISCWDMLSVWQAQQAGCFHFAIESAPEQAFFGCPPERLFLREGERLSTEAIAGTCPRSWDPEQDSELAQRLLKDGKNLHENQLVIDDIYNQLAPLAESVEVTQQPEILVLSAVQHLKSPISATLTHGVSDCQLLQALHPTAAIGGLPRKSAADYIYQHEPVERGWYAGAFGMIGEQHSEFCVTIRSVQQRNTQLSIYAGAGIVAGSRPQSEWHELNSKLAGAMGVIYTQ